MVVTLFKLMYGISISLVTNKAALNNCRHFITWPVSKGWFKLHLPSNPSKDYPTVLVLLMIHISILGRHLIPSWRLITTTDTNHSLFYYKLLWISNATSHLSIPTHRGYMIASISKLRSYTERWKRK